MEEILVKRDKIKGTLWDYSKFLRRTKHIERFRIFVYGSLKKGYHNHKTLERKGVEFLGEGKIKGFKLYDTGFGFPAIVRTNLEDDIVYGEYYEVDVDTLILLDVLEGYTNSNPLYRREYIDNTSNTMVYVYNTDINNISTMHRVISGKW